MGEYSLPFLVFCIVALVIWAMMSERKQDRREADEKRKAEINATRTGVGRR